MSWKAWAAAGVAVALLAGCGKPAGKKGEEASTGAAPGQGATGAPAMPERKPGLWNLTVDSKGATQTFKICLDVATDKKLSITGSQTSQDVCKQTKMGRTADGSWEFADSCDMGEAGHIDTTGMATGDLTSKYTSKATQVTTGAKDPSLNGTTETSLRAEWLSPCPSDFAPGDMELPGGIRMNISNLKNQAS